MKARIKFEYIDATCMPEIITCLLSYKDLYRNNTGVDNTCYNYRILSLQYYCKQCIYSYIPSLPSINSLHLYILIRYKKNYITDFFIEWNQMKINCVRWIWTSLFRTHTRTHSGEDVTKNENAFIMIDKHFDREKLTWMKVFANSWWLVGRGDQGSGSRAIWELIRFGNHVRRGGWSR